jgi:hypothetical protein
MMALQRRNGRFAALVIVVTAAGKINMDLVAKFNLS